MWLLICFVILTMLVCIGMSRLCQYDSDPAQALLVAKDRNGSQAKDHRMAKKYRYSEHWGCY